LIVLIAHVLPFAKPVIYVNQIAFDSKRSLKLRLFSLIVKLTSKLTFSLINAAGKSAFTGLLTNPQAMAEWLPGKLFYRQIFQRLIRQVNIKLKR
jgi:hypothetical protein